LLSGIKHYQKDWSLFGGKMIYTSNYKDWKSNIYKTYSISGDCGREANYTGECYPELAPKYTFWRKWRDNIGKIPEDENNKFYIHEYWNQVLSHLDPADVYRKLDNSVLLCYEPNDKFCHRHIVAAWFEILLDEIVPEVKIGNFQIEERERPSYIKEYLENEIKNSRDMRGFNSPRALYLFEKSEELETKAAKLEKETGMYL
jgi:uncharacterized protein (DUF488 family)